MTSERLHPAAFLVEALSGLRETLLPALIAFFVSGRGLSSAAVLGLLAVALSALLGYVRWSRTAYWVQDDALHLRSGVLSPDQKTVPIARISAIDEVQGPVQRLFGVVALHVQTAGGGTTAEIVLTAVERRRAEELRAALGRRVDAEVPSAVEVVGQVRPVGGAVGQLPSGGGSAREGAVAAGAISQGPTDGRIGDVPAAGPRWRLSRRELLVAALTGPQLGVAAPFVAGGLGVVSQALGDPDTERLLAEAPGTVGGWLAVAAGGAAALAAIAFLGALIAFGDFEVVREPRRLWVRRGIIQRRAASIGIERVHAVRIVEGVVRRPLGLCAVRLEVAGYAREAAAAQTLIPLCRRSKVAGVLAVLVPELPAPDGAPETPPARATRRYVLPPTVTGAVAGAVVGAVLAAIGVDAAWLVTAFAVVGLVAGAVLGAVRRRAAGWWLDGPVIAIRAHDVFARATTIAAVARLQHAELQQSPPQRIAGLATLQFAVASARRAAIAHLDAEVAERLLAALRPKAAGAAATPDPLWAEPPGAVPASMIAAPRAPAAAPGPTTAPPEPPTTSPQPPTTPPGPPGGATRARSADGRP